MDKCVVTLVNKSTRFWLRGTTWTFSFDIADKFDRATDAQAAIENASKFYKKSLIKRVEIWSGTDEFLQKEGA